MSYTIISTEENLRKEIEEDFDYNYFMEAGAGAGKTKLVIDRIACQLASGKYKPEEIVAITFTNKAAQELLGRIANRLTEEAKSIPENEHIKNALRDIGRMQISTIHSFCHRILKENCFDAKLRLDFELLEEEDAEVIKSEFFTKWLAKNGSICSEFYKLCPKTVRLNALISNFCAVCDLPVEYNFKYRELKDFDLVKIGDIRKTIAPRKIKLMEDYIEGLNDGMKQSTEDGTIFSGLKFDDPTVQNYVKSEYKNLNIEIIYKICKENKNIFCQNSKKTVKESLARISEYALSAVENQIKPLVEDQDYLDAQDNSLMNTLILNLVLKAREEYKAQVFNKTLTNDILLQRTNELLDNQDVVRKLQSTFKCIYLDESQDTDKIQNELIMKMATQNGRFIPGMLFIVGDVKQSIYRFREADYRLFNATKDIFLKNPDVCKVRSLNINNRSNEELVNYYNNKVSTFTSSFPGYQNMIPRHGSRSDDVIHGVYTANEIPGTKDYDKVVRLINHLVGNAKVTVFNKDTEKEEVRTVEYSDFLVLTRKSSKMNDYVVAFQRAGIPVKTSVEYIPSTMKPLVRFANIYRYLAMPYYRRAREGVLGIAQLNPSKDFECNNENIKNWREQTKGLNATQIIGWLLERSELYIYSDDIIEGASIKRYQMAIRQMIEQVLSKTDTNAMDIANALMDYVAEDNVRDREIGYDKYENAVRFMNIHKAKGLEGNIVIIAQRSSQNTNISSYTDENDRYQVVSVSKGEQKNFYEPYYNYADIRAIAVDEETKEADRLEYVAVTRAREALIFMPRMPRAKNEYFIKYVDETLRDINDQYPVPDEDPSKEKVNQEPKSIIHANKPDPKQFESDKFKISPSGLELHRSYNPEQEMKEITIDADEDFEEDADDANTLSVTEGDGSDKRERSAGDIFGTIVHRAFELAIKEMKNNTDRWELCVNRAINENNDDIDLRYKAAAEDTKKEFFNDIMKCMPKMVETFKLIVLGADEVYTEYPFSITITGDEIADIKSKLIITEKIARLLPDDGNEKGAKVWINGKADLIIKKGDEVTIWDYKSDKGVTAEDIHSKYDNQMNLYKWVFEKHFGGMVNGKFYSLEIGEI